MYIFHFASFPGPPKSGRIINMLIVAINQKKKSVCSWKRIQQMVLTLCILHSVQRSRLLNLLSHNDVYLNAQANQLFYMGSAATLIYCEYGSFSKAV